MKARIYPIWHKGKKIYFTDWTNLSDTDTAINVVEETTRFIEQNNEYDLLELLDVRGSYASAKVLLKLKEAAERTKNFSRKKAIVGITGSKKILLMGVNRFIYGSIKGFEDIDKAKEWLTAENN
jgi:predicted methyltransferase MtxX (methanogen marker protein 4)